MNEVINIFKNDSFAKLVGSELLEISHGKAKAKLDINSSHLNSNGTVHGGVVFSLADVVFAVASNSYGTIAMGINVSISYFKAVKQGTLYASAEEISINPKLATYLIKISDDNNDIIALFQGTVYRKKDKVNN